MNFCILKQLCHFRATGGDPLDIEEFFFVLWVRFSRNGVYLIQLFHQRGGVGVRTMAGN